MNANLAQFVTAAVLDRFLAYAKDAGNWSGEPLVGGNVGGDPADRGYIVNMKKAGIVETIQDGRDVFLVFTQAGADLAAQHGVKIKV